MDEQTTNTVSENKTKKIAVAFLLLVIGVFLAISFFTFFFTWKNDQSELLNKTATEILFSHIENEDPALSEAAPLEIQNKGGKLGAIVAKKFIHDWFGIGSFSFVFLCFFFMLYFFNIEFAKKQNLKRIFFVPISLTIISSITFGFFFNDIFDGNIGGCLGYYFSYQLLRNILGTFITALVIIATDLIYIFFTFKQVLPFISNKIQAFKEKREAKLNASTENEEQLSEATQQEEEVVTSEIVSQDDTQNEEAQTFNQPIQQEQIEEQTSTPVEQNQPVEEIEETIETESVEQEEATSQDTEEQENTEDSQDSEEQDSSEESTEEDKIEETQENNSDTQENIEDSSDEENEDEEDEAVLDPNDEEEENSSKTEPITNIGGMQITNTNAAAENTEDIKMEMQDYDPKADLSHFKQPDTTLLKIYDNDKQAVEVDEDEIISNKNLIEKTLSDFKINIEKISATVGPTITLYEIVPAAGTKISKIQALEKDIMMSLSALGIRIIAPIPGKGSVGIEVPNKKRQVVSMYSVLNSKSFKESTMELPVALGRTITNEVYMFDLAKTPHLLVAGATGQGKSVGLNAIVTSLLYKKHPSQLKFVLVDPKMVEFSIYEGLKNHYMAQYPGEEDIIITDCMKVQQTLKSLVQEMENRYKLLMEAHCRNIIEYNDKFIHRQLNPNNGHKYLSYIVIIIDEFGDFIMQAGKEIETPIARIAQKARAVGMHLILATQRPSVNIITGIIKANVPSRMAFKTASGIDSKTILDAPGAEGLVGRGDLLISTNGAKPERVQCAFVDTPEVERIVKFISDQQSYGMPMQLPEVQDSQSLDVQKTSSSAQGGGKLDPIFEEAAQFIVASGTASTSFIQRKFEVGYNRAGRIMDQMERHGIVGPSNGSKARELKTDTLGLDQILNDLRAKNLLE
ncbi:MAG: DNA translocase FtsK 4TM domain-containing protein [Bacteroidales bacterium]|nr:DNA translocase FtsK 4TM domain-containing protein [Bacteroidales bacterium]